MEDKGKIMNENRYLVSVIVPIYNAGRCLNKCLSSIETDNVEVILIDDGSTDDSYRICEEYRKNHVNCVIHQQKNGGVSKARNVGIDLAHGEWICFIDADDYVDEDWFEKVSSKAIEYKNTDILLFGKQVEESLYNKESCIKAILGDKEHLHEAGDTLCWVFSKFYRREFIQEKKIRFIENLINGEDMLFNCMAFYLATEIRGFNISYYYFFKNMQSSTNSFNPRIVETEILFHDSLKCFLKENHLLEKYWIHLYKRTLLTGVYGVLYRVTLSKESDFTNIIDSILKREEYKEVIKEYDNYIEELSKIQNFVLKPLKTGNIKRAQKRMKLIYYFKNIYYKKGKDGVIVNI